MLNFVKQAVYGIYNWSVRKLRSMALDFIALFNKKYADSKRIGHILLEYTPVQISFESIELKYDPQVEYTKMFKDMTKKFTKMFKEQANLENVILVRIQALVGFTFSYHYGRGRDPVSYALGQASKTHGITKGNMDLVLLLWLMYVNVPIDGHGELLDDLVKSHSGSRAQMIEKLYLLQEEGKLSINSRENLDWIIKMSPLIEKQYISNKKYSIMKMISSGNINGLEKRFVEDIEKRVKELTDIDIVYDQANPASSLKNISIHAVIENNGLFQ